ncbi:MAG TPA: type I phosphomannose isomerase catalytic subunit [Tepidisphaeraceae bacterium]|jgi:mannose-6-phosphate isomerase
MAAASIYPLKFKPRFVEKIWGGRKIETVLGKSLPADKRIGESWEIYDFPPGVVEKSIDWVSVEIANGPLAGRSLHWVVGELGADLYGSSPLSGPHGQFPLLIKFLDAREDLSVQVHPDLAYANANPGAHIKTEAWYVLQSDPGSRLLKGLKPDVTREAFQNAIHRGDVENLIYQVPASAGDCYYLPSGTVHALGAGILVAEVQTPSDTTFRVFDFNRVEADTGKPRELHIEQAMACIDFSPHAAEAPESVDTDGAGPLVDSPFFRLHRSTLPPTGVRKLDDGMPLILIGLEGVVRVIVSGSEVSMMPGEVVLVPAAGKNGAVHADVGGNWLEVELPR